MKIKRCFAILFLVGLVLGMVGFGMAAPRTIQKGKLAKPMIYDMGYFNGNRIWSYLENDGTIVTDDYDGNSGMYWPSRSSLKTINYCSGVWVAGKVNGEPVTACAEYTSEWVPGKILPDGTPDNKNAPQYKLYKINKADALNPIANPDWMNWPVDQGAPWIDTNGNGVYEPRLGDSPAIMGDQMIWYVMNDLDNAAHANLFNSPPIGLECKVTIWGYNRPDEFGDMMFAKFQIYNKKSTTVDSCYLGIWADIDLGDAADDFVGCDPSLSLGYTYNEGDDRVYGSACPAIGYDFFQGAIVPSPGDIAWAFGRHIQDYKNLGMTAFIKYINAGGDIFGDPETAQQCWNFMSGLTRSGAKYVDPTTGQEVYPAIYAPGDPVAGTGWLDALDHPSGDRRQLMSCGPFVLTPGDSQEVVTACIIAQGSDALNSITRLKAADLKAQTAYDLNFQMPSPPPPPIVSASAMDRKIVLTWQGNAEDYVVEDLVDMDEEGNPTYYTFQGYNVYQYETPDGIGAVKKIATFDIKDLVMDIRDYEFVGSLGEVVEHVVQKGTDSGAQRFITITSDALRGGIPLVNNRPYYFVVTAYGYNPMGVPKTLESPPIIITVYPQEPFGTRVKAASMDTLEVVHNGPSQGSVTVFVVDPSKVTGHDYKVTFSTVEGEVVWNVVDVTTGETVLANQTNQSGDEAYDVVDGLMIKVVGPEPGINWNIVGVNPYGEGYEQYFMGWGYEGERWFNGYDLSAYYEHTGLFGGLLNGYDFWGVYASRYVDVKLEIKVDPGPDSSNWQRAFVLRRDKGYALEGIGWFPGKLWNVSVDPPEQLNLAFVEDNRLVPANNLWDMGWLPDSSKYANDGDRGNREYIWMLDSPYDVTNPDLLTADWYDGSTIGLMYAIWPVPRGTRPYLQGDYTIYVYASKPNSETDEFVFTTQGIGIDQSLANSKKDIKKINVFPNPYFGANVEERRTTEHFVRFTHLPNKATIRIYTLAGELVRTIEHNNPTQYEEWNLLNDYDIPVASGMYIVHVDCGSLGEKILKLALIIPEERLRQY